MRRDSIESSPVDPSRERKKKKNQELIIIRQLGSTMKMSKNNQAFKTLQSVLEQSRRGYRKETGRIEESSRELVWKHYVGIKGQVPPLLNAIKFYLVLPRCKLPIWEDSCETDIKQ